MDQLIARFFGDSPLVQGGVALMLAGWLGYQLRAMPVRIFEWLRAWNTRVVQVRDAHPHYDAWLKLLTDNAVRRGGPRTIEVRMRWSSDDDQPSGSYLAAGTDDFWARVMGKWCHVEIARENGSSTHDMNKRFMITVEVMLCSRAELERLYALVTGLATTVETRQVVDLYDRHGNCTCLKIPKRDPTTLCLPRGLFEGVESRLRDFCGARDQYERAGIPWRFGVLLSGEPGTGKTSFAHALASTLGLRIAVITLADLETDRELVDVFRSVTDQAVILIEDVDCAFRMREGEAAAGVSFSGFLNCIDGVLAPQNGRILIMSTNHVDRLDPALTRPGRVDLQLEVPLLTRQVAADYADRVFPQVAVRHDIIDSLMESEKPTPAMLINQLSRHRWRRPVPRETATLPIL
jgi:hypothetical protein